MIGCGPPIPFYLGLSGGTNFSKVNFDESSLDYISSVQIAIEFESFAFSGPKNAKSTLLYGVSYESKNYKILNSNNEEIQLESSYLTIPVKYQHLLFDIENLTPFNILLGGFYSFKLNEISSSKDIEYFPQSNYGVITGLNVLHFINSINVYIFIEYNFQYGFASTQNTVANSGNVSHVINIGFKFPSTIF
jgi:hypothetical protein